MLAEIPKGGPPGRGILAKLKHTQAQARIRPLVAPARPVKVSAKPSEAPAILAGMRADRRDAVPEKPRMADRNLTSRGDLDRDLGGGQFSDRLLMAGPAIQDAAELGGELGGERGLRTRGDDPLGSSRALVDQQLAQAWVGSPLRIQPGPAPLPAMPSLTL